MLDTWQCVNPKCSQVKAVMNGKYCPECGEPLKKLGFRDTMKVNDKKREYEKGIKVESSEEPESNQDEPEIEVKSSPEHGSYSEEEAQQEPQNPMIDISFYESMPGRVSLDNNKTYINGILEIADSEMIIHKRSFWRGKDRGTKHIRYDKITSVDYDKGKFLALPSIQVYLSSVDYSFRSNDKRLESFYDIIREKIDEASQKHDETHFSELDELKKLAELKEMGVVTEEEFELKKKQLLKL
jgi:hypothetical protein